MLTARFPNSVNTRETAMIKGKWMTSVLAVTATVTVGLWPFAGSDAEAKKESVVNAKGALRVPVGYRTRHESLGSWSIADADAGVGAKEMHVVYASPRGGALGQLS
jgi:hypothetical protein